MLESVSAMKAALNREAGEKYAVWKPEVNQL